MYNIENIKTFFSEKINVNPIPVPVILEKNIETALKKAKDELKSKISPRFFKDLIEPIYFLQATETTLYFVVKNSFAKNQLNSEIKIELITKINNILDAKFDLEFVVESDREKSLSATKTDVVSQPKKNVVGFSSKTGLNKFYTFSNYVVGDFNQTIFNIGKMLLKNNNWKSFCIVGGVGQGKTHFLHAFGNSFCEKNKDSLVKFTTGQDFVREFYSGFENSSLYVEELKNKYKSFDLLIIDDLDFICKKTKINEILLSILIENGKQSVIFSLSNYPNALAGIDKKIVSRLRSGLIYKLNEPSKNDFKKILIGLIKIHDKNLSFSDDALTYVANRCNNDLRVLEGVVQRLLFSLSSDSQNKKIITIETIKKCVSNEIFDINPRLSNVSSDIVIEEICKVYNVSVADIISNSHNKILTHVRHVCFYVLKEKLDLPWTKIGQAVGNRAHSTVIEGYKKIKKTIDRDSSLKEYILKIYEKI